MKYVKRFFLAVTVLTVGGFVWWAGMNYTGYCHAEGRYLSDEEKIKSAVQYIVNSGSFSIKKQKNMTVNGVILEVDDWYRPENPVKFKDEKEFFDANPSCCSLHLNEGEGISVNFMDRITGYLSSYVHMEYKVKYIEEGIEKFGEGEADIAIKNCGEILTD